MSRRAAGRLAAAVAAVLVAPGCGAERRTPPDVAAPAPAESFDTLARPAAGLRVALPAAWTPVGRPAPLVAVSRSGSATISRTTSSPTKSSMTTCGNGSAVR